MSALLGFNEVPYYSWKGKTLTQITSILKMNKKNLSTSTGKVLISQLRKPQPLRIIRKEIANVSTFSCARTSIKIDEFNRPGGSIVNSLDVINNGLVNTLAIENTTISSEHPGTCNGCTSDSTTNGDPFSPIVNARKRVRSAGMIVKKFNASKNNDKYYTSTNEYLLSRNRAIGQRDYIYFRNSNSGIQPGTGNSKSNIYTSQGYSHCTEAIVSPALANNQFQYIWLDANSYSVVLPTGTYDTESLNNAFKNGMVVNGHYFINNTNQSKNFLLSIDYNGFDNTIIISSTPGSRSFPFNTLNGTYSAPIGSVWYDNLHNTNTMPTSFIITTINFATLLGFASTGTYSTRAVSTQKPQLAPRYDIMYYKPSNITFGVQGSVDSSTYTHRSKFNAVNKGGYLSKSAFGDATANAMAYGVSEQPLTLKSTTGFGITKTPVIDKITGKKCNLDKFIYRRG